MSPPLLLPPCPNLTPSQCGYITDRAQRGFIVHRLLLLGSLLTLACYAWLALPPRWTRTAVPALVSFGAGHGFSTRELPMSSDGNGR